MVQLSFIMIIIICGNNLVFWIPGLQSGPLVWDLRGRALLEGLEVVVVPRPDQWVSQPLGLCWGDVV